jgi:hypothetical protein
MKASQGVEEGFGSSRKVPKMLGKVSGRNYSTPTEFYSKRLLRKASPAVEEACQTTVRVSGVPEMARTQTIEPDRQASEPGTTENGSCNNPPSTLNL